MDVDGLIVDRPDQGVFRVHRSTMTSSGIFELEKERIFDRSWLFVGHESEIENRGEYRRRTIAGRPVFLVRGSDGQVRVFLNTCTHRGAMVCRRDEGKAETFQCFYHAWTFNNRGELIGIPDEAAYGDGFDRGERGLKSPPRVDCYRGMYFVSFDPEIEDLSTYLAGARELIDLTLDSAEVLGGWKIMAGTVKYSINANWKLLVENSMDGYHLPSVHQTYLEYMAWRRELATGKRDSVRQSNASAGRALGNGHAGMITSTPGRPIATAIPLWSEGAKQEAERLQRLLIERFGAERGREMAQTSRHMVIYPNLMFQDSHTGFRLRQIWPVAPNRLEVTQWELAPRQEREDLHAYRMEGSLAFLGPGGLATPDDVEALESCQLGFGAREAEWSDISRGMTRDPRAEDELQMRAFWRQWKAQMSGLRRAERTDDFPRERSGLVAAAS